MDIYRIIRKLAKSIESQNLYSYVKDIKSIRLFYNEFNLSKLQQLYLFYLNFYDVINNDINIHHISKYVFNSDVLEDSYMKWRREEGFNQEFTSSDKKKNSTTLIRGTKIIFKK
jgi:hypothetical protein